MFGQMRFVCIFRRTYQYESLIIIHSYSNLKHRISRYASLEPQQTPVTPYEKAEETEVNPLERSNSNLSNLTH